MSAFLFYLFMKLRSEYTVGATSGGGKSDEKLKPGWSLEAATGVFAFVNQIDI
jgi:hypothetical protein